MFVCNFGLPLAIHSFVQMCAILAPPSLATHTHTHQANSSQSQLAAKASTECNFVEMCNFRSEHSSMHLERLQDLPHTHKQSPQKNESLEQDSKDPKPGSGAHGTSQAFHIASQMAPGIPSGNNNSSEAGGGGGGAFAKGHKQKGVVQDSGNDGDAACDGGPFGRAAGMGKRGCSNSSESDDSAEAEGKQRQAPNGVDCAPGEKDRAGFEDDDDERTDSADEGDNVSDGNYIGLSLNSRDGKFRVCGDKAGPTEKAASSVFVVNHHPATGSVSPVNMVVGYGAESLALRVMEKAGSASVGGSPTMNSPRQSSAGQSTPDTPNMLSPEVITSQVSKESVL